MISPATVRREESGLLSELRQKYLDNLPETQELFLEELVSAGTFWSNGSGSYAVTSENILIELYVDDPTKLNPLSFFEQVLEVSAVTEVLCKSFDTRMLYVAASRTATVTTAGLMFRRVHDESFIPVAGLSFRPGRLEDADVILDSDDGFFSGGAEINRYIGSGDLFVLESGEGALGCGIVTPVLPGRPDRDIGMMVFPRHRRKGYGTHIVSFLKDCLLAGGLRPVCGCAADNQASARTLHKAGFLSEHRLLKFSY